MGIFGDFFAELNDDKEMQADIEAETQAVDGHDRLKAWLKRHNIDPVAESLREFPVYCSACQDTGTNHFLEPCSCNGLGNKFKRLNLEFKKLKEQT